MTNKPLPPVDEPTDDEALDRVWSDKPRIIRDFLSNRLQYEQLCNEVSYILRNLLDKNGIEYSAVTSRAKTLNSFLEKLDRKEYPHPLEEITDFAGVRLVYLYRSDCAAIEKLIEAEFEVREKADKVEEQATDRFGYSALHYLVHVGKKNSGARYDDLKGMVCEIQVRTVLQDAWAIIDHHLVYKQEAAVPRVIRRKLNSLSGLFETADDQFDQVRTQRAEYIKTIQGKVSNEQSFLQQDINIDTIEEFLKQRYPNLPVTIKDNNKAYAMDYVSGLTRTMGYSKLQELENDLKRADQAVNAWKAERSNLSYSATGSFNIALAFLHPELQENWGTAQTPFKKYSHLITDANS